MSGPATVSPFRSTFGFVIKNELREISCILVILAEGVCPAEVFRFPGENSTSVRLASKTV